MKSEYKPNARWEHEDVATVKAADIARSESTHAHRIGMESQVHWYRIGSLPISAIDSLGNNRTESSNLTDNFGKS